MNEKINDNGYLLKENFSWTSKVLKASAIVLLVSFIAIVGLFIATPLTIYDTILTIGLVILAIGLSHLGTKISLFTKHKLNTIIILIIIRISFRSILIPTIISILINSGFSQLIDVIGIVDLFISMIFTLTIFILLGFALKDTYNELGYQKSIMYSPFFMILWVVLSIILYSVLYFIPSVLFIIALILFYVNAIVTTIEFFLKIQPLGKINVPS